MASRLSIDGEDHLYGTTTVTTWLGAGANCCGYHTFTINSKDPNLVLFGHQGICGNAKHRIYVDRKEFIAIYSAVDGQLPGFYPVIETRANPPFVGWHQLKYENGRPIIWYVRFEDVREFLVDEEVWKYYLEWNDKYNKDSEKVMDSGEKLHSQKSHDRKGDSKFSGVKGLHGGASLIADGEDVSGSGSRPRRMTRGQDELAPQICAFSAANNEKTAVTQPPQYTEVNTASTAEARQPLQMCPYHGTDRCEVDDPSWFDKQQALFERGHHPADSCTESTNRESHEPELRVRHHHRAYLHPARVTNYRPAQVELHQETAEKDANNENEKVGLCGEAGGESDSDNSPSRRGTPELNNDDAVSMSGYVEDMGYAPRPPMTTTREQQCHTPMAEASDLNQYHALTTDEVSGIILPEECRCILRMVKDCGGPAQAVPLVWKSYCLQHNPNTDGRQPWQLYLEEHGTAPPPYQGTEIAPPEDPRPPKDEPSMGLRGGAQPTHDGETESADDGDDWTTTPDGIESDADAPTIRKTGGTVRNEGALRDGSEPFSVTPKNTIVDNLRKYADGICLIAEELEKYSFGSDAPMTFGCDTRVETPNSSTQATTEMQKPAAKDKPNMGLRGGARSRRSRRAGPSRAFRHRGYRDRGVHFRGQDISHTSRQQSEDMRQYTQRLRQEAQRAAETISGLDFGGDAYGFLGEHRALAADQQMGELDDEVNELAVENARLRRELAQERVRNATANQDYTNLVDFNEYLGKLMMEKDARLARLYQERSQAMDTTRHCNHWDGSHVPPLQHGMPPVCRFRPPCPYSYSQPHPSAETAIPVPVYAMFAQSAERPNSHDQPQSNIATGAQVPRYAMAYGPAASRPSPAAAYSSSPLNLRGGGVPSAPMLRNPPSPTQFFSDRDLRRAGLPKTERVQSFAASEAGPIHYRQRLIERVAFEKKERERTERELEELDKLQNWRVPPK